MLRSARPFAFVLSMAFLSAMSIYSAATAQDEPQHPRSYYPTLAQSDLETCQADIGELRKDVISHYRTLAKNYAPGGASHYGPENDADSRRYTEWANTAAAKSPAAWYAEGVDDGDGIIHGLKDINENAESNLSAYRNLAKGFDASGFPRPSDDGYDVEFSDFRLSTYYAAQGCVAKVWMAKYDAMHPGEEAAATGTENGVCTHTPDEELAAFKADVEKIQAAHPQPDVSVGARNIYRWSYALSLGALDKLEQRRTCLGKYYSEQFSNYDGIRISSKKGCEDLSSAGGSCPVEFP